MNVTRYEGREEGVVMIQAPKNSRSLATPVLMYFLSKCGSKNGVSLAVLGTADGEMLEAYPFS